MLNRSRHSFVSILVCVVYRVLTFFCKTVEPCKQRYHCLKLESYVERAPVINTLPATRLPVMRCMDHWLRIGRIRGSASESENYGAVFRAVRPQVRELVCPVEAHEVEVYVLRVKEKVLYYVNPFLENERSSSACILNHIIWVMVRAAGSRRDISASAARDGNRVENL